MPWCETCSRFWTPTSMQPDGACPTCGNVIAEVKTRPRAPWHFVLLVIGVVVYLAYRAVQGVVWLAHHG
jgi:hypothetical protein